VAPAEEKRQMPGAALAAAKWPQQHQQEGPFQDAAAVRTQNVFASAQRASAIAPPDRDGMSPVHRFE
jgi:hypothetical protein